jgi:hypothetical protein
LLGALGALGLLGALGVDWVAVLTAFCTPFETLLKRDMVWLLFGLTPDNARARGKEAHAP